MNSYQEVGCGVSYQRYQNAVIASQTVCKYIENMLLITFILN